MPFITQTSTKLKMLVDILSKYRRWSGNSVADERSSVLEFGFHLDSRVYMVYISPHLYSVAPCAKFDFALELRNVIPASGEQRL
jgi:hypothetical protein